MRTQTIQATVDPRLLTKASRLFTGTIEGRIIEVLQNARRAGATEVHITNENGLVTVRDNGRGIDDFQKLLDLGSSGWEEDIELSEDPAGVGLFCLAPRETTIRSNGKMVTIQDDGWTGAPVEIASSPEPVAGTIVQFRDEEWNFDLVSRHAVFSGLKVTVDGKECPQQAFVSNEAVHYQELGCRIEVRHHDQLDSWHHSAGREPCGYYGVLVNFHGQVVAWDHRPIEDYSLRYLVDLTGEPTGIRLMLPARTRLVENEAFESVTAALEMEAYRFIQRQGTHELSYKVFLRAKELGIVLPEAEPTYKVGLLYSDEYPEPVEVRMPKGFPLERCYRYAPQDQEYDDLDAANIHLLAALGRFKEPFEPEDISRVYDGYSWARLPTIEKVTAKVSKVLHKEWVWCGELHCAESIRTTAHTSDGKVFSSDVCMAVLPANDGPTWMDTNLVFVTPAARHHLASDEIWYHLGGYSDEGDTWDTQSSQFAEQLQRFWANLIGPDEHFREGVLNSLGGIQEPWEEVTITARGSISIRFKNGTSKTIEAPPAPAGSVVQ